MHTKPMKELDGTFNKWKQCKKTRCRKCNSPKVLYSVWESNCGGYEDSKYKCNNCGYWWWVDGIDS